MTARAERGGHAAPDNGLAGEGETRVRKAGAA